MHQQLSTGPYCTERIGHLDAHLSHMQRSGMAESTIRARRMVLTWLAEWLGEDPADATPAELDEWQASLPTLNAVRWQTAMINPYYRFLQAKGYRPDNPAALLPRPRTPQRLPKPIPEDDLLAAVAAAPLAILPWLLLAGWSGLRAVEIAGLDRRDILTDDHGRAWARVTGKGGGQRDVPIPDWAWEVIEPLLPESGPCWRRQRGAGPVTRRHISQNINYYLHEVRGLRSTLHTLRHRVATMTLRNTKDVRLVQQLLGHRDLSTLHVYTQVQQIDVATAVASLPAALIELRSA